VFKTTGKDTETQASRRNGWLLNEHQSDRVLQNVSEAYTGQRQTVYGDYVKPKKEFEYKFLLRAQSQKNLQRKLESPVIKYEAAAEYLPYLKTPKL
jgi:hypothetical protein